MTYNYTTDDVGPDNSNRERKIKQAVMRELREWMPEFEQFVRDIGITGAIIGIKVNGVAYSKTYAASKMLMDQSEGVYPQPLSGCAVPKPRKHKKARYSHSKGE